MTSSNDIPPELDLRALPHAEQAQAWLIQGILRDLDRFCRDFAEALSLFDFCYSNRAPWHFLACRDGAMTIFHFGQTLHNARKEIGKCPTLFASIDRAKLRDARKLFEQNFPHFAKVRHAVAHAGEKAGSAAKLDEHAFSGSFEDGAIKLQSVARTTMSNILSGRSYSNSWEGEVYSYEISGTTLQKLQTVKETTWAAFTDPKPSKPA